MHAIQTSGTVRNVTADHFAGIAPDEVDDPRPYCEINRQWATLHPVHYLPRKFKIAVTGAATDRAASEVHDVGLHLVRDGSGCFGFRVLVGGGLGRAPMIGQVIREFLPREQLLAYLEAILRVYNRQGRRDNIHKARIKILVKALGIERFRELVDAEWQASREHARGCRSRKSTPPLLQAPALRDSCRHRRHRRARAALQAGTATTRARIAWWLPRRVRLPQVAPGGAGT
jgi:sulfite reductase (NADPH) hemoprotein beta-component